jgi:hypothetical protein
VLRNGDLVELVDPHVGTQLVAMRVRFRICASSP